MAPHTDAEAIAASLSEPRAFVAVFDRHFDAIHRYLRRRVGSQIADELAAETFAQAFEHRKRYDRQLPMRGPGCTGSRRTYCATTTATRSAPFGPTRGASIGMRLSLPMCRAPHSPSYWPI